MILKNTKLSPQHPTAQPYVLSLYAHIDAKEPASLIVTSPMITNNISRIWIGGSDWQRYIVRLAVPPNLNWFGGIIRIRSETSNGRIFLDILQMEQGLEPTEFEP